MALTGMGMNSFITIYSYKPAAYLTLATLYHINTKKLGLIWLFIHAGAVVMINQYDLNAGYKKVFPEKWNEYHEATKNYELALSLINVPVMKELKKMTVDKVKMTDYLKILEKRPH